MRNGMKRRLGMFLFAGLLAGVEARADVVYSYSYTGAGISGSGTVTLAQGPDQSTFLVTAMDGQVSASTNQSVTGVLATGSFHQNDNYFYNGNSFVDAAGVSFGLADGSAVNIFFDGSDYYFDGDGTFLLDNGSGPAPAGITRRSAFAAALTQLPAAIKLDQFSFAPFDPSAEAAVTPEPSSLALLGTGLAGIVGVARRRMRSAR